MRTAVASNSLAAYHSLSIDDLQARERDVMLVMVDGLSRTRREIADALGWRDGPVTGRCNSLVAKGWLEESGTKVNKSGKTATLLRLPVIGQRGLFA